MCTVVEPAIFGKMEDFLEVMPHFLTLHVERTESFDAWRIDNVATYPSLFIQFIHLRESRSVFSCVVGIADFASLQVQVGQQIVDKRRLSHTAVA